MQTVTKIQEDLYYVGFSDRRISFFENAHPVDKGMSYNSYILLDEKTALFDTVDKAGGAQFLENISFVLKDRTLDYLIVNHVEPDHCALIYDVIRRYPQVTIVCNQKSLTMLNQFFDLDFSSHTQLVKELDTINLGKHVITFMMAPMVHWPEVMVSFDLTSKTLFSADAFGTFGALNGNLFADEVDFEKEWLSEARRYYANIVGKYGVQTQSLLAKASQLEIKMLCPLHGPIWRRDISWYFDKYQKWATYTPEEKAVVIAYGSIYGNTENAASIIANNLATLGIKNIKMYDVTKTDPSYLVSEAFRASTLVFASSTYNAGIFINMERVINDLTAHNIQNRSIAIIENGSWAPNSGSLMKQSLLKLKGVSLIGDAITINSSVKKCDLQALEFLSKEIAKTVIKPVDQVRNNSTKAIENNALYKISYGLFVLTCTEKGFDNGCIVNTVSMLTESPHRITVYVNKDGLTHDMILRTKKFNVSVLTEECPFEIFKRFGFASGKNVNKFQGDEIARTKNGVCYLPYFVNSVISAKVVDQYDYGTHTLFVAEIEEAFSISDVASATYAYYFAHIKPKPVVASEKKKGWVCKICGYIYEGEDLPKDYICPICKHGAEDFEKL